MIRYYPISRITRYETILRLNEEIFRRRGYGLPSGPRIGPETYDSPAGLMPAVPIWLMLDCAIELGLDIDLAVACWDGA